MSEYTAEDMRRDLALTREELEYLREENDRLERILQSPLSLKDLQVAWEAAESLEAYRSIISEGDVLIIKKPHGIYLVRPAYEEVIVGRADAENVRILSRAPKREPWADLADALVAAGVAFGDKYPDLLARTLYEHGVRMAGNEEER